MTRTRWILAAVVLILVAAVAWYFASPSYTLSQMKAAAEANDSEAFVSYVDFPALREDMKAEMMAQMMAEAQEEENEFAGLGLALGTAMVGPMIDNMITPAGVRAMFLIRERRAASGAPAGLNVGADPIIERKGLSTFLVTSQEQPGSGMVFTRHGLSWKLSGVDLPVVEPGPQ